MDAQRPFAPFPRRAGSCWVDIRAYETDELEAWLGKFHLSDQKHSLRTLDTVVSSQLRCFEFMSGLNRPFLDLAGLTVQFQFSPINAHAANQNVDRLEKTIVDLRQRFEMNQQEKTNRRLAVLTILSAIFMPITLIAGIYGMNFEKMPELHFGFGYPAVLICMGLIAGVMYLYFKTRGWLD